MRTFQCSGIALQMLQHTGLVDLHFTAQQMPSTVKLHQSDTADYVASWIDDVEVCINISVSHRTGQSRRWLGGSGLSEPL